MYILNGKCCKTEKWNQEGHGSLHWLGRLGLGGSGNKTSSPQVEAYQHLEILHVYWQRATVTLTARMMGWAEFKQGGGRTGQLAHKGPLRTEVQTVFIQTEASERLRFEVRFYPMWGKILVLLYLLYSLGRNYLL